MCGIAGYINFNDNFVRDKERHRRITHDMTKTLYHRGPDSCGEWIGEHAAFGHSRLAVIDIEGGVQPMERTVAGYQFVITYNGELYNTAELKNELLQYGYCFTTSSDTEVLLYTYIHYGTRCAEKLNGIYSFCIWDSMRQRVFMCRDRFGVKPLFWSKRGDGYIFGSEQKAILAYPGMKAEVNNEGLCEIFAISPARTQGVGVFNGIEELRPGRYMVITRNGVSVKQYFKLEGKEHTDSYEDTVEKVRELVTDSIRRQLVSDVPIGTLLSGGLDSSLITAVGALEMAKKGQQLSTYSFDYKDNEKYFKASAFQPDSDAPWVKRMAEAFSTNHTYLVCDNDILLGYLDECVHVKDLPGMADVDASLLYFCRRIKERHTVILSGECSDEIFGGYPWFRSEKAFKTHGFPWCYDLEMRKDILLPEVEKTLDLDSYSNMRYEQSIAETPTFEGDSPEEKRRREISWLNLNWFMTNLLDRKDRMSMASGLEVRVPFCDHRIVRYVFNVPWSIKNKDNISKSLLREASRGILPEDVLMRKKSPYPKTHNPNYEKLVKERMLDTISDRNAPILSLCDYDKIAKVCTGEFDYGKPFFGQLMAGPQFIGFLLQVNEWLKHYRIRIV